MATTDAVTVCVWTLDADEWSGDSWDTSCGEKFCFNDGSPAENKFNFCPHCGRRISEVHPEVEEEFLEALP